MFICLTRYRFGGTNGIEWFNEVWKFEVESSTWSLLDSIGYIPVPREGHSAALIDSKMYIFGGRSQDGTDLGDLAAYDLSQLRWYTFQNMGPAPSPRSGHGMCVWGKEIFVLAGESSSDEINESELSLVHVLDTRKIRYPTVE